MAKRIYAFGGGKADGDKDMKNLLGGKGAGLAEMSSIGIPVPPGFTITTEVCTEYYKGGKKTPKGLEAEMKAAMDADLAIARKVQEWFLPELQTQTHGHELHASVQMAASCGGDGSARDCPWRGSSGAAGSFSTRRALLMMTSSAAGPLIMRAACSFPASATRCSARSPSPRGSSSRRSG